MIFLGGVGEVSLAILEFLRLFLFSPLVFFVNAKDVYFIIIYKVWYHIAFMDKFSNIFISHSADVWKC